MSGATLLQVFASAAAEASSIRAANIVVDSLHVLNMTHDEMARATGYQPTTIAKLMRGTASIPWRVLVFAIVQDRALLPRLALLLNP